MTNQHPITPPPELVQCFLRSNPVTPTGMTYEQFIATRFSQWGADQELEACCEVMRVNGNYVSDGVLRAIRRPKLLSDKEQALNALSLIMSRQKGMFDGKPFETIRQALEALPND
jgi:hypothetical protein